MNQPSVETRRAGRGLGLLELSLAMTLVVVVAGGLSLYGSQAARKLALRKDAQHFSVAMQAAQSYLTAQRQALSAAGAEVTVDFATLQAQHFIAASDSLVLANGQRMALLIKPIAATSEVEALLITYGGANYGDSEVAQLASVAGGRAGFVVGTAVQGVGGRWSSPLRGWIGFVPAPSRGHLAALLSAKITPSTPNDQWLSRTLDTAKPELNQMETSLGLAGNARQGGPCDRSGLINSDNANVLICTKLRGAAAGFVWATPSDVGRFDTSQSVLLRGGSTTYNQDSVFPGDPAAQRSRDMFLSISIAGGYDAGGAVTNIGCGVYLEIEDPAYPGVWRQSRFERFNASNRNKDFLNCSLTEFVPKGAQYRFWFNHNFRNDPGNAIVTASFSKFED